jgi:hypothetical protein
MSKNSTLPTGITNPGRLEGVKAPPPPSPCRVTIVTGGGELGIFPYPLLSQYHHCPTINKKSSGAVIFPILCKFTIFYFNFLEEIRTNDEFTL